MDSKCLFENAIGINPTTKSLLLIDLSVLRQSYERRKTADDIWVQTDPRTADKMTKIDFKNVHISFEVMELSEIDVKQEGWLD